MLKKVSKGEAMYPDQIKNYTTEKQFEDHKKMLEDMKLYFEQTGASLPTFENIRKEQKLLARCYRNWKRRNR